MNILHIYGIQLNFLIHNKMSLADLSGQEPDYALQLPSVTSNGNISSVAGPTIAAQPRTVNVPISSVAVQPRAVNATSLAGYSGENGRVTSVTRVMPETSSGGSGKLFYIIVTSIMLIAIIVAIVVVCVTSVLSVPILTTKLVTPPLPAALNSLM